MSIFHKGTVIPTTNPVPESSTTHGIDIYHEDIVTDWSQLLPAGFAFCMSKATEGMTIRDSKFADHWQASRDAGLIRGAYHFLHPDLSGPGQAEFFVDMVNKYGGFEKTDMWPILDWEYANGDPNPGDDAVARAFLQRVEELTDRVPMIYTNAYIPDYYNNPTWMAGYPLWVAAYSSSPRVPMPWSKYTFWQYTDSLSVPGVGNPCDVSVFQGSVSDLAALIKG